MKYFLILVLLTLLIRGNQAMSQTKAPVKPFGKLLLENDQVKVYEYESSPGKDVCGLGKHSHPAHLTVILTDATVTITSADGKVTTQKVSAGTTFWSEAETHTVINSGTGYQKCQIVVTKNTKK